MEVDGWTVMPTKFGGTMENLHSQVEGWEIFGACLVTKNNLLFHFPIFKWKIGDCIHLLETKKNFLT